MEGGLDVAWLVVYTAQGELNEEGYNSAMDNAIAKFDAIDRLVYEYAPDKLEIALNSDDVRRILSNDKKVIMIGVENAYPIGLDASNIERFWKEVQDMYRCHIMAIVSFPILILVNLTIQHYTTVLVLLGKK